MPTQLHLQWHWSYFLQFSAHACILHENALMRAHTALCTCAHTCIVVYINCTPSYGIFLYAQVQLTPSLTYSTIGGTWWYTLTPHLVTCTGSIPFNCVHFWVGLCTELLYHSLSFSPALLLKHSLQQLPHMCSYIQRPIGWMTVHASCAHRIGPLFVHTIPIGLVLCTHRCLVSL